MYGVSKKPRGPREERIFIIHEPKKKKKEEKENNRFLFGFFILRTNRACVCVYVSMRALTHCTRGNGIKMNPLKYKRARRRVYVGR